MKRIDWDSGFWNAFFAEKAHTEKLRFNPAFDLDCLLRKAKKSDEVFLRFTNLKNTFFGVRSTVYFYFYLDHCI